jgi:hypothetical protein
MSGFDFKNSHLIACAGAFHVFTGAYSAFANWLEYSRGWMVVTRVPMYRHVKLMERF